MTDQHARFDRFVRLVLERNRDVNITAAHDEAAIAAHLGDSLLISPYVTGPYVDIGSGGGFPAIPVAIATGVHTTMIESVAKKARFLKEAADALELDAVVLCERAEVAGRDPLHRERYGTATARAVGPATTVLELLLPLLAVGGRALLQRGAPAAGEAEAVAGAALMLGGVLEEEIAQEGVRRLLIVRKVGPTPAPFPRGVGIPSKRPLCL